MYCYTIQLETEYGITDFCDICSATPLENATEEEIIKAVEASGGIGATMIIYYMETLKHIYAKRIPTIKYLTEGLYDVWWDFREKWFDITNLKNRFLCYLIKYTHLYSTTIYTFLHKVDITELQFYIDEIKKERE